MEKRPMITSPQLFIMLFVSRMVVSMTYGSIFVGCSELWDHVISAVLALFLTWVILIPIYKLFSADKKMNIFDNLQNFCGGLGKVIILAYSLYFLAISMHTLAVFEKFIAGAINPTVSVPFLSILLIASSCYGACKGLEALVRTSGFIFIATILAVIFFVLSLIPALEIINYKPFTYSGNDSVFAGLKFMVSQSSCIPALAVLMPMAKGNHKKEIFFWNAGIYFVFVVLIYVIIGTMGDFVSTQLFPVYTAAGIGKFGSFKHLDSVYLGIWVSGIFIKLSLFLMLAGEGVKKIFGEKFRKISILMFGSVLVIFAFFEDNFSDFCVGFIGEWLLWLLFLFAVAVPIVLAILRSIKMRKGCVKIEKY